MFEIYLFEAIVGKVLLFIQKSVTRRRIQIGRL